MAETAHDAEEAAAEHFAAARSFEADLEAERQSSRAVAWRVAIAAVLAAIALAISLAVMVMRYEPVAFLVEVNKQTGETSVMKRLDREAIAFNEFHDKHNLKRFVQARESYFYPFLQRDYNLTVDMSCEPVAAEYAKQFDGEKALDKVLGNGTEWKIHVLSVRLLPDQPGRAVVTFDKTIKVTSTNEVRGPFRFDATLAYEYRPNVNKPESIWIDNPTGFTVCAYRADPVQVSR